MHIRRVDLARDAPAIAALDTSFDTDTIYEIVYERDMFRLVPTAVSPPVTKRFPIEDLGPTHFWQDGFVAVEGDRVVGFTALREERWNRRLVIWHLYVDRASRGGGIGYTLLTTAFDEARARDLHLVCLETSNLAYPSVQWYRRQGFELCGLDTTRYVNTDAAGETSLFLARSI